MTKGIKTVLYPVKDMTQSKTLFTKLLGVAPYADSPYYIGFKVDDQYIGLIPNSPEGGVVAFFHVEDISNSLQVLVDAGATVIRSINDVGGGRLVASVKDTSGNIIGLIQN
jgi:predicted enzyme related to lactoylglutathione lyase